MKQVKVSNQGIQILFYQNKNTTGENTAAHIIGIRQTSKAKTKIGS